MSKFIVTIENENGDKPYELNQINLYKFNDTYISEPISLTPGNYKLTSFLVTDENDSIINIAPKEDSKLSYLVSEPLPLNFSVSRDETTKVPVEVISVSLGNPEDFGYATFELVKTFNFCIAVFHFDEDLKNFELTSADLSISSNGQLIYSGSLLAATNNIILPEKKDFDIKITKSTYNDYCINLGLESMI